MRRLRLGVVALVACALLACTPSPVTSERLGRAFASTFANLIVSQEALLGRPGIRAEVFAPSATCARRGPGSSATGSGDWTCTVTWSIPSRRGSLRDTYEVSVSPDACFSASADPTEAHVGGLTVPRASGGSIPNLLYAFEGCFDPGS